MPVSVKICGITNIEDAHAAVDAGAHALGFVFHRKSPRCVEPEAAKRVIAALPPFVLAVGVFVNEDAKRVRDIMDACGLSMAQLHGDETAAYCESLGRPVLRALRLRGPADLLAMAEYRGRAVVRGFLVDAYSDSAYGGTGHVADWTLAAEAAKAVPVVLAGGLTAGNVADAIRRVRPYGVDVSSGVEREPGKKDHAKVAAFIEAARLV
jgi:phosphoribosylanthranilate isomerase